MEGFHQTQVGWHRTERTEKLWFLCVDRLCRGQVVIETFLNSQVDAREEL